MPRSVVVRCQWQDPGAARPRERRTSSDRAANPSKGEHHMATVTEPRRKAARKFQTKLLIDGKFRDSHNGKTFTTINPATEEVIAEVAEGDATDIDLAVKAARKAFESGPWRKMDARDRGRLMGK